MLLCLLQYAFFLITTYSLLSQWGLRPWAFASLRPKSSAIPAISVAELGFEWVPPRAGQERCFPSLWHLQSCVIISAVLSPSWGQQDTCLAAGDVQHLQGQSNIQESDAFCLERRESSLNPIFCSRDNWQIGVIALVCSDCFCLVPCSSPQKTFASELSLCGAGGAWW